MKKLEHIAFIMDGNRRWAREQGKPAFMGHTQGAKNVKTIALAIKDMEIPFVTFWALSTENLKNRSEKELVHLFSLLKTLPEQLQEFIDNNVRIRFLGDLSGLPNDVQVVLQNLYERTAANTGMTLTLAINYGGRDELRRVIARIVSSNISSDEVTESFIEEHLDTAGMPEVGLLIRTGGQKRLSGFLPWQCVYAELFFTDTQWPAFSVKECAEAADWFHHQQRNHGK